PEPNSLRNLKKMKESLFNSMGFSQEQIQDAIQAGCFTVTEATEWLLQGRGPRHRLTKQAESPTNAFSAFNPPKNTIERPSQSQQIGPNLVLNHPSLSPAAETELQPLQSRMKQDQSSFQLQQRHKEAQEAQHEKRQKKQERELILKRIAEDRRLQQEKAQASPTSSHGNTEVGHRQSSVDDQCILMIRLPSGESMRECFPADAPLRSVVEHVATRHPSLPAFSLLQGFPRKRFSEGELASSLRSLGLTPNAALCIQTVPPVSVPQDSENLPDPRQDEPPRLQEEAELQQPVLPRPFPPQLWEEAVGHAGFGPSGPSHYWGRGQRLVPGEADDEHSDGEEQPEEPAVPFLNGTKLELQIEEPGPAGPADPGAERMLPGDAAVQRLQRAAQHEEPSPPKKPFRPPSVPSLCSLATRASVSLITAPCMQYSSSLAGLTPGSAELLLGHMTSGRLLRPRTLELFFGCPLRSFILNSYPYTTNELLRQLRAFTALKHLSLVNSPLITDAGLSVLSGLLKLQHLNLSCCSKLTDSCLQHITKLQCLTFLALDKTKVSDAGLLTYLKSAPSVLVHLSLNETGITETTLTALPQCVPQLRLLSIARTKVSDVSALAELHCLQTLHLDGTSVNEDSLQALKAHLSLSTLSLACVPVANGNHVLEIISGLRLYHLTLPGRHSLTDAGLLYLSRQILLSEVDLTDYTQITDHGITQLSTMNRLKKLSLSNTQVSDAGLVALVTLKELVELCLDRTAVSSRGVAALITHLPYLQVIGLACTRVGDTVVRRGLVHCSQLLKLNLSRTRITDRGLKFLYSMRLNQVNLDGTGVTVDGVANLISACPQLTSVRASNTRSIPPDQQSDDEDHLAGTFISQ
uniref:UBX domain-containing protein n=1 Tax=Pygocentrus nattereri TaxID=42514 RepID=A0A3B4D6K3_PYGNA